MSSLIVVDYIRIDRPLLKKVFHLSLDWEKQKPLIALTEHFSLAKA
jgi:hypothetical protein